MKIYEFFAAWRRVKDLAAEREILRVQLAAEQQEVARLRDQIERNKHDTKELWKKNDELNDLLVQARRDREPLLDCLAAVAKVMEDYSKISLH